MKTLVFLIACVLFVSSFGTALAGEETYAQRLGWGPEDRVLMIHSDDIGMSYATNEATIEALEFGTVNSVSVMMPTPWVTQWRDYMKAHPDVDTGLHLTLTCEWRYYRWRPLTPESDAPGLVDADGYMWSSVSEVIANADPAEVEMEIRAQIAKARRMGLPITHLDSHMGTLYTEQFIEPLIRVAIEENIPVMMPGPKAVARRELPWEDKAALLAQRVWDAGLPVVDDIHTDSYGWKTTDKVAHYVDAIRGLAPGVTVMIVHPTKPSETADAITDSREHLYGDYYALIDPKVKAAIEEEGIIMTTWRELGERRAALSAP